MLTLEERRREHSRRHEDGEAIRPYAVEFIEQHFRKTSNWHSIYGKKQMLTNFIGYVYEADVASYFQDAGFQVKTDIYGKYWVKADYKRKSYKWMQENWAEAKKNNYTTRKFRVK